MEKNVDELLRRNQLSVTGSRRIITQRYRKESE